MALAAVMLALGVCREGWKPLGSRCVYQTAGQAVESACAADCASVVRPWVVNDTGGVPMCIKSQDEYEFVRSWVGDAYWTGFRRLGASDNVAPPADWRTGVVHPQGSACSASANPWFDSLMSHDGAGRSSNTAPHAQRLTSACVDAQPSRKIIQSGPCASRRPLIADVTTMQTVSKTAFFGMKKKGRQRAAPCAA